MALPDIWQVLLRVLIVLASSTTGLVAGSFLHYAFFEETLIYRGSATSTRTGNLLFLCSILLFLLTVYSLYLNRFSPILVSMLGMLTAKLTWNLGDGLRYAGHLYEVLTVFNTDDSPAREYLARARNYRQIQDLRSVALTMFVQGSSQLEKLDALIDRATRRAP